MPLFPFRKKKTVPDAPPASTKPVSAAAKAQAYLAKRETFAWDRPERYNFVKDTFVDWAGKQPNAIALHWVSSAGEEVRRTYAEFADDAARAAAALQALGVGRGDVVLVILSREQRWWEIVLGCMQLGAVVSPGTVQLTEKDIAYRLTAANAKAVVTAGYVAERVDAAAAQAGWSGALACIDAPPTPAWKGYEEVRASVSPLADFADTAAADPALCYFTSGTTGNPKLTLHRHDYPLGHKATGAFWLGAEPDTLVWNLSDTGWAKAAWSSLFAPWLCGAGVFALHTGGFDLEETLACLQTHPVGVLCAPPTIYRMFVRRGLDGVSFRSLTRCMSAGEPLNPEVMELWRAATGMQIREGYGQTETVLLCGTFDGMEVKPGSMGLPAPGVDVQIIDDTGAVVGADVEGDIAVNVGAGAKPGGMFIGYHGDRERTAAVHLGDWYLTGDRATRDADGYFWFVGRNDDVILSSGYRIGPFEVESVLFEHDAVAESAVVSSPDDTRGEVVKAFVVLAGGHAPSDELATQLQDYVKEATAPYKYPRKIEFVAELPKTVSGKIKRKELRDREWRAKAEG